MVSSGISARGSYANRSFCGTIFEDDTSPRRPCSSRTKLCKINQNHGLQWYAVIAVAQMFDMQTECCDHAQRRSLPAAFYGIWCIWQTANVAFEHYPIPSSQKHFLLSQAFWYFGAVCQFLNWLKLFNGWCIVRSHPVQDWPHGLYRKKFLSVLCLVLEGA